MPLHPLKEQRESVRKWRQIGLGLFGLADCLIKLGLAYGSKESLEICERIGAVMADESIHASAMLAKEKGTYPEYKKAYILKSPWLLANASKDTLKEVEQYGLHNSQLLTCAPTGTLSTMLGISGGIEPIFAKYYTRKTESLMGEDKYYKIYTQIVWDYMQEHGLSEDDDDKLPSFIVTAHDIPYENRIKMQSVWQSHIDASISSTVNLPKETTVEQVADLYMKAFDAGLKGITVYRDGCKRGAILTEKPKKEEKKEETPKAAKEEHTCRCKPEEKRGYILKANDSCIGLKRTITSGCGNLHVEAFFDPKTGDLYETYFSKGSTGGCNSFMSGLSRMVSLAARAGAPFDAIVDQLHSTLTCPSYAMRRVSKGDVSKGNCCPGAIAYALEEMHQQMLALIGNQTVKETIQTVQDDVDLAKEENKDRCPECGEPNTLVYEGGCVSCKACGWSRCS